MTYDQIPEDLKSLPNWVGWKLEERNGKPTKIPYSSTHDLASSTDPKTWRAFTDVCGIPPTKEKGIGFVFGGVGEDGKVIVGIDLDKCLDESGNITNEKFVIVPQVLKSYTEVTPSETGLHIIVKCSEHPYYYRDEPNEDFPEGKEHFGKRKNNKTGFAYRKK